MADINQWRRMIHPSRTRTSACDGEESEEFLSPSTPRRAALKPKLSSYFPQYSSANMQSPPALPFGGEPFDFEQPSWFGGTPMPDADSLIDSVMCRLLADPSKCLDSSFNGVLLQIFESYRSLSDEKRRLQSSFDQEIEKTNALGLSMRQSAEAWEREKQEYKAEVKRLELILAQGQRGLAEVALARQESVLRRGKRPSNSDGSDQTLETIFELLERSRRYEERLFNHQRASMRRRPASPSAAMRRLSKQLTENVVATKAQTSFRSGTSNRASMLPESPYDNEQHSRDTSEVNTVCSDASFSTLGGEGDLLSDEDLDVTTLRGAALDNESNAKKATRPAGMNGFVRSRTSHSSTRQAGGQLGFSKHPTLKAKASGFFAKWRSPLRIDSSSASLRRFSFEPGDDDDAAFSAPALEGLTPSIEDRLLRKSVSTSILFDISSGNTASPWLTSSPAAPSSTASTRLSDANKPSRIPTPVYSAESLAKPRSERDSSASSLLTAIRCSDGQSSRSCSQSTSACGSPTATHAHTTSLAQRTARIVREKQGKEDCTAGNNFLIDHTNALRGNAFAIAAAKAASIATNNASTSAIHEAKRPRMSSRSSD